MNKNILFAIIGMVVTGILGYYANVLANKNNNALLVQLLKDLNSRKTYLQDQLNFYSQKFGISS